MLTRSQRKKMEAVYKDFVEDEVRIECKKAKGKEHGNYVIAGEKISVLTCLTELFNVLLTEGVYKQEELIQALAMACADCEEKDDTDESE